jgi:hypothetical protein
LQRFEHLSGGIEGHVLDRNTQPARELAREVPGHAARLAAGRVLLGEHAVAEVDGRAQLTARREVRYDIGWNVVCHGARDLREDGGQ